MQASGESPLHILNPGATPIPLFAFPPSIGFAWCFDSLAATLPEWQFSAFDFVPGEERGRFYADIIEQLGLPEVFFLGYSAGASLAFKVALELEQRKLPVRALIVLDRKRIGMNDRWFFPTSELETGAGENLKHPLVQPYVADPDYRAQVTQRMVAYMRYSFTEPDLGKIHVPIHLILADGSPITENHGWGEVTAGPVTVTQGAGEHSFMFAPEFIGQNSSLIRSFVTRVLS